MPKPPEIVEAADRIVIAERELARVEQALAPSEARGIVTAVRSQLEQAAARLESFLDGPGADLPEPEPRPRPRPVSTTLPAMPDAELERLKGRIVCARLQAETIKGKLEWWNGQEFILVGDAEVLDPDSPPDPGNSSGWMTVVRLGPGGSRRLPRSIALAWR